MAKKTSMKKRGSVVQKDSALHLVSEIQQSMNTYNDANGIMPTYKNFSENPLMLNNFNISNFIFIL